MAKLDSKDPTGKVANRHAYARISYLYQAANYLSNLSSFHTESPSNQILTHDMSKSAGSKPGSVTNSGTMDGAVEDVNMKEAKILDANAVASHHQNLAAYLASHIGAIGLKSKAKVSREVKRTICKRCNSILIPGKTSRVRVENRSKESRKSWADMLIVQCDLCAMEKRYPIGMESQAKQPKKERPRRTNKAASLGDVIA